MVVKPKSTIGAKGAIQTMKNKQFTVAELQEAINNRLSGLAGRKYEGTEFHSWINGEIAAEFEERGITELCPSVWSIKPDMIKESGVSLYDDIARIKAELKRDKRYKWSAGRGVLLAAAVEFREELLPLSLDGARRFMLNEQREKMMKNCAEVRDEALKTVRECEAELERLKELVFLRGLYNEKQCVRSADAENGESPYSAGIKPFGFKAEKGAGRRRRVYLQNDAWTL